MPHSPVSPLPNSWPNTRVSPAVFAMTNRFKENAPQTWGSVHVTLPDPTSDHRTIVLAAVEACRQLFRSGYGYKKAGVLITRLVQEEGHTRSLFEDTAAVEREARLSGAIDAIHQVYGQGALLLGVQGDGQIKMAREHCSPHYTTRWEELPGVVVR